MKLCEYTRLPIGRCACGTCTQTEGSGASPDYAFERIANGFIVIDGDGDKVYLPDIDAVLVFIVGPVSKALNEARHFECDGKFQVSLTPNNNETTVS